MEQLSLYYCTSRDLPRRSFITELYNFWLLVVVVVFYLPNIAINKSMLHIVKSVIWHEHVWCLWAALTADTKA